MPIDTSIYAQQQPVKFNDPFKQLADLRAQQQERQLRQQQIQSNQSLDVERRQKIAKEADAEAVQQKFFNIISTSKTPDDVEARIRAEAPEMLAGYQKQRSELDDKAADIKKKAAEIAKMKGEVDKSSQEYSAPFLQLVEKSGYKPEVFDFALNTIGSHFDSFPVDQMRQQAAGDPAKIKQIIDGFKSTQQQQADTTATTAAQEAPKRLAEGQIATQQAANMSPEGLTPDQQRQQAQAMTVEAREQQRLSLERQRVKQEGERLTSDSKLVKVEHKDPTTGKTVLEWLPQSQVRGQTFEKGTNATTENRLASAQAVQQTGNDLIAKLSDPAYAKSLGVVMGRVSKLRDFIGNPPPEYSELAGQVESYALANMGVHGMRSAQGAAAISKILDQPHTPASLIAAIRGLNSFSEHFMQNEGRQVPSASGTSKKVKMQSPNGQTQDVDESDVEHYKSLGATVVK